MLELDPADGWALQHWWTWDSRISLRPADPSMTRIMFIRELRAAFPELNVRTSNEMLEELRNSGAISLGVLPQRMAVRVRCKAQQAGLTIVEEDLSREHFMPYNPRTQMSVIIEDDDEADRVAQDLLRAGAEVHGSNET